jgi:acetolactate synthase-1/3 small subunit
VSLPACPITEVRGACRHPPWPPLAKGGKGIARLRRIHGARNRSGVFQHPPWPPLAKGGKLFETRLPIFPGRASPARISEKHGKRTMSTQPPSSTDVPPAGAPERPDSGRKRHLLSALVQNQPGVLAHVSGMFSSRGFNIESLAVGETENPHLSRITVVVMGDDRHLDQVRKQLEKIVTVVKVHDISREDYVERDLMLIKVHASPALRPEINALVQIFRGRILDVSPDHVMIEISGQEKKIEAFIEQVRPYGIHELARTGRIALVRGDRPLEGEPDAQAAADSFDEAAPTVQGHSEL